MLLIPNNLTLYLFQNCGGAWHWVLSKVLTCTFWNIAPKYFVRSHLPLFGGVSQANPGISIGIHKRFPYADFTSWSRDFAKLTNRKLLGMKVTSLLAVLHTSLVLQRGGKCLINFRNLSGLVWKLSRIFEI